MGALSTPGEVLDFWREAGPERWFTADTEFDARVRERFLTTHAAAAEGRLAHWEEDANGALAHIIVLDQFPRNMFRGTARAFATDAQAREAARRAIERGLQNEVDPSMRGFFFLPFMHSEELADQEFCVALYREANNTDGIKWAELHLDAIRRFGRFPHRNVILGRASTPEEIAYLEGGGFSG